MTVPISALMKDDPMRAQGRQETEYLTAKLTGLQAGMPCCRHFLHGRRPPAQNTQETPRRPRPRITATPPPHRPTRRNHAPPSSPPPPPPGTETPPAPPGG